MDINYKCISLSRLFIYVNVVSVALIRKEYKIIEYKRKHICAHKAHTCKVDAMVDAVLTYTQLSDENSDGKIWESEIDYVYVRSSLANAAISLSKFAKLSLFSVAATFSSFDYFVILVHRHAKDESQFYSAAL